MKKLLLLILLFPFLCFSQTKLDLQAQTKNAPGTNGQLITNNNGNLGATDPIISWNYVNLFTAISATGTQTSSVTRVSTLSQFGTLFITWASITGSPSGCTVQIKSADSVGNLINNGSAISVTPSNGTTAQAFAPASTLQNSAQMQAVYSCTTTYPTAGTLTLEFVPAYTVAIVDGAGHVLPSGDSSARSIHVVNDAGSSLIGEVNPVATATTTDSSLECTIVSAASTNATNCKGSAGNFYGYEIYNTTTTVYYLRLYNTSSSPTCSSATGFIRSIPIPPASSSGLVGGAISSFLVPVGYGTGVSYCITGGSSSTDNTNAAVGIFGAIRYK